LLGSLDKKAAYVGGALTHRLNLEHALMVKDNHYPFLDRSKFARDLNVDFVEFEVDDINILRDVIEIISTSTYACPSGILFDNWNPRDLLNGIDLVARLKNLKDIFIEVSGGIRLDNLIYYDLPGINYLSTSDITMNPYAIDLSLELAKM
jgi:nicotinate-nucleotide pyrophosphorylase (carboxylating)